MLVSCPRICYTIAECSSALLFLPEFRKICNRGIFMLFKSYIKEYIDDHDIDKVLILVSTDVLDGSIVSLEWED